MQINESIYIVLCRILKRALVRARANLRTAPCVSELSESDFGIPLPFPPLSFSPADKEARFYEARFNARVEKSLSRGRDERGDLLRYKNSIQRDVH